MNKKSAIISEIAEIVYLVREMTLFF